MSLYQKNHYQAYSSAILTVARTRQVVMLYDTCIKYMKQVAVAIAERRIEDRYHLTQKSTEILVGLQSSIDFDSGGKIAGILHNFYTHICGRILALNLNKNFEEAEQQCYTLIEELKEMREVWHRIDSQTGQQEQQSPAIPLPSANSQPQGGITVSA